jgi:hypothetical protein
MLAAQEHGRPIPLAEIRNYDCALLGIGAGV